MSRLTRAEMAFNAWALQVAQVSALEGSSSKGLGFGFCSARLQAGMSLNLRCPPEGGRYKIV